MPRSIFWHRRTRTSEPRQGRPHILVVWQAGSRIGSSALDILTTSEPISQGALPHWMLCSSRIGQTSDIICTREELQYLLRKWHHRRSVSPTRGRMHATDRDLAKSCSDTSPIAIFAPQEGPAASDREAGASVSAQRPAPIRLDSAVQRLRNAQTSLSTAATTLLNASAIFGQASRYAV